MEKVRCWRAFLTVTIRGLLFAMVFIILAFITNTARAQGVQEPTWISIGAPAQINSGERLTLQAVLVDSHSRPISKATIYFTTHTTFLNGSGDVVLAQAVTNKNGQAVAQFEDDFSGEITLRAEFRGDPQYASSNATAQINVADDRQVYDEHIGVDIPGLNVPPVVGWPVASVEAQAHSIPAFLARIWPSMTGWPIAVALIIVWSLYFRAVTLIYRIASSESKIGDGESTPASDRRRLL